MYVDECVIQVIIAPQPIFRIYLCLQFIKANYCTYNFIIFLYLEKLMIKSITKLNKSTNTNRNYEIQIKN